VLANRLSDTVRGHRGITAETALRLGRFFGTGCAFWINQRAQYALALAERERWRLFLELMVGMAMRTTGCVPSATPANASNKVPACPVAQRRRGPPRHMAAGYRIYRKLAPGPWFT
jgi:hypothetical protein